MNGLFGPQFGPWASSRTEDPVEALQTDVMRFMAILGLCLMAIFSIVQSIAFQPEQSPPQVLHRDVQQQSLAQLERKVDELQAQVAELQSTLAQTNLARTEHSQRQQRQLASLQQTVAAQRGRLKDMERQMRQQQQSLQGVQRRLEQEQQRHRQQLRELAAIEQEVESQVAPEEREAVESAPRQEEKVGFSLRFQSDQALLHLLQQRKVTLYVVIGRRGWQVVKAGEDWRAEEGPLPKQYYQMAAGTVPSLLKQRIARQLALNPSHAPVWAVDLPPGITGSIQRIMQERQGGDLVIDTQGGVTVQN